MDLFTNKTGPDCVRNAFVQFSRDAKHLMLACPFYSSSEIIREALSGGCSVQLIIRLCDATRPEAIAEVIDNSKVQIRFFVKKNFHSKLYIFGDEVALVGSANLTDAGVQSNQEICVTVRPEDARFDDLVSVFSGYWDEAHVLDNEVLKKFRTILSTREGKKADDGVDQQLVEAFGDIAPSGVQVSRPKPSKEKTFLHSYRKTYQEFLSAFRQVEKLYQEIGQRRQPEHAVPLRIEIDQFFSFIREEHTLGDSFMEEPLRSGDDLTENVRNYLDLWFRSEWAYLDEVIPGNYRSIQEAFGKRSNLSKMKLRDFFEALQVCHSFRTRFRRFRGGMETYRETFIRENEVESVRNLVGHLLHDGGDFVERMADSIFDPAYKIRQFGRSGVQELYGWVNNENIPICNARTVKALRFLGFPVKIFDKEAD